MDNKSLLQKLQLEMTSDVQDSFYSNMMSYKSIYNENPKLSGPIVESLENNGATLITDSYLPEYGDHILIIENEDSLIRLRVHDSNDNKRVVGGGCFYKQSSSTIDKDSLIKLIKAFDSNVDAISVRDDGTVIIKTITSIYPSSTTGASSDNVLPEYLDKNCREYILDNKSGKKYTFNKCNEDYIDEMKRSELPDSVFGIPEERKYPMPDKKHVYSAIKLFGHVEPKYEKTLASNIKKRMKQYGISKDEVGNKNKLKKYL